MIIDFGERTAKGERVRCGFVTAPSGYGKSRLADRVVDELVAAGVSVHLVAGDLVPELPEPGDAAVVIVDDADRASAGLLNAIRLDAASSLGGRSFLLLARTPVASPELIELAALSERDNTAWRLGILTDDEVAGLMQVAGSSLDVEALSLFTGAIPMHVDRLCRGWDDAGWPGSLDGLAAVDLPDLFADSIELQIARLESADRAQLAERAVLSLAGSEPVETRRARPLIEAGLAISDGSVPIGVALSVLARITQTELDGAIATSGLALLKSSPDLAASWLVGSAAPLSWSAVALVASGEIEQSTALLNRFFAAGESVATDGAALAAAAHVAALEARWAEAARLVSRLTSHPYWSPELSTEVAALYRVLAGEVSPEDLGPREHLESGAAFLSEAVSNLGRTFASNADLSDLPDRLRELVRQSPHQQPMVDIAVSGSEVAAMTALIAGEFEVARLLIERSPEASGRTPLSAALGRWISLRSGAATSDDQERQADTTLVAPTVLDLAARTMSMRRTSDIPAQAEIAESIVSLGAMLTVDVLTFDAICEVHLGAHRVDARREATALSHALRTFVERLGSPVLWETRLRWNELEAAVAADDHDAVGAAATALIDIEGARAAVGPLCDAATMWVDVLDGEADISSLRQVLTALETNGYKWEAASLAGQAAIRTSDAQLAKELLQRGRDVRQLATTTKVTSPAGLTEREIEIGELVLIGHSYKEIGATCFISPKTVEHHVAHIRQKLAVVGVSRAEFRAALEADLHSHVSS